jgi:hypothetical protein
MSRLATREGEVAAQHRDILNAPRSQFDRSGYASGKKYTASYY